MADVRTVHLAKHRFLPAAGCGTVFCVMTDDGRVLAELAYLTPGQFPEFEGEEPWLTGPPILKETPGISGTDREADMGRGRKDIVMVVVLAICTLAEPIGTLWMIYDVVFRST
jgi:hypothetical protein